MVMASEELTSLGSVDAALPPSSARVALSAAESTVKDRGARRSSRNDEAQTRGRAGSDSASSRSRAAVVVAALSSLSPRSPAGTL